MKKIALIALIVAIVFACEKNSDIKTDSGYLAKIVGFDLNCSTCILEFPDNSAQVIKELGESPQNYYQTINLSRGDYEIGQLVRVKIRKADVSELRPCITLNPSYDYQSIYVTDYENFDNLVLNDTIELSYKSCLFQPEKQFYICLDSLMEDSRCPIGAYCIWAGNARVRFRFEELNEAPVYFVLNTFPYPTDNVVIGNYKIKLIDLTPYPSVNDLPGEGGYKEKLKAKITVTELN